MRMGEVTLMTCSWLTAWKQILLAGLPAGRLVSWPDPVDMIFAPEPTRVCAPAVGKGAARMHHQDCWCMCEQEG